MGGDRLPVKVPTEDYPEYDTELSGTVSLHEDGCWTINMGDGERLLVFPEGFVKGQSGSEMVSARQPLQVRHGDRLAFVGGPVTADAMPGVPDGYWGNYLAFCEPELDEFVILDSILSVGQ